MRRKSAFLRVVGILCIPVVILGSDFAARLWLLANTPQTAAQFRFSRPIPYQQSAYFSAAFADEQGRFAAARDLDESGFWATDFHGTWYNHDGHVRRTTDQPAAAEHTIYMLGNSTLMDAEVPDGYTISSYLQRLIGAQYRVVNLGSSGMIEESEYLLLKTLTLKADDIVIFYDGIADADLSFKTPEERRSSFLLGRVCDWLSGGLRNLGVVQMYCAMTDLGFPTLDQHSDPQALRADFEPPFLAAMAYCKQRGVSFYHFLQPQIWSKSLSLYEQSLQANYYLIPVGMGQFVSDSWAELKKITLVFPSSYDLTHSLDALRSSGVEVYLDFDHVTERGNAVIARAIYDYLTVY